ncbi:putative GTP diphosphokinase RSH2 chloroplastic [Zea mays]|uniref:Putative GTP diphosphokinase RSH2 chloroplastic n=1 Tax=Zea mays TaxID=4577 RepID=A0A1D6IJF5_MAIZE|nr:putative GTP diphosphokinase RSH2 chloroplastic [Zea mays]
MRTLDSLSKTKQQSVAKETLEIFAPLANQLGILNWKEQLENLCFKYLYPENFDELSTKLIEIYNIDMIAAATRRLEQALQVRGLSYYAIYGRHQEHVQHLQKNGKKSWTNFTEQSDEDESLNVSLNVANVISLHFRKKLVMDKIYDIHGGISPCTRLFSLNKRCHSRSKFVRGTCICRRSSELLLIGDIREGERSCCTSVSEIVEWVRWVTWHCQTLNTGYPSSLACDASSKETHTIPSHSDACLLSYSKQCDHKGPVLVILLENEKMSVQEIPQNWTILDLLKRSSNYGMPVEAEAELPCRPQLEPGAKMADVLELIPSTPCKSRGHTRELHQKFDHRLAVSQS